MATLINPIGIKLGLASIIVITAPTGSTVTLTTPNGTIKTTTESSGTWTFSNLTEIGTYTASATLSSQSTSSSVLVDAIGLYEVTLSFVLYLYNEGDLCTDVSGGWQGAAHSYNTPTSRWGTLTNDTTNGYIYYNNSGSGNNNSGVATVNAIDTTGYSKIVLNISEITVADNLKLAISNDDSGYGFTYNTPLLYQSFSQQTALQTVTLNLDQDYNANVFMQIGYSDTSTVTAKIHSVYLSN